ncbi:peptidase family M1 [Elysia marginata]|uniref:Peptidase family M1 n=1 Tax=Elysia marginata TaxID=1093978 RepID=A0AAV4I575_9GAST|nr:peptidase family M1 [Elysia marginata]
MAVNMDVKNYRYRGVQKLNYYNESPDTLKKVFYHLYFNAFQPGSEMDIHLKNISDPDQRMINNKGTKADPTYESRISLLKPNEIGYLKVLSLKQDGIPLSYKVEGTILEVTLNTFLSPRNSTVLEMTFEGQVPLQIRRSGRNSNDGIALSMTQWYPKIAEYDTQGWHTDPYIAREFQGVWGDFDVSITIDKNYMIGGTGYLQNHNEIGFGYEDEEGIVEVKKHRGKTKTWRFIAPNVHDFAWVADPKLIHDKLIGPNNVTLHFLYKDKNRFKKNWQAIQPKMSEVMQFFNTHIGDYPWNQYSFLQGGDGGMEYAMCTLVAGGENYDGLLGTCIHELAHSWFQHALASNESLYAWMDEGFTSYISTLAKTALNGANGNPFERAYKTYTSLAISGEEEPATTHADRFSHNFMYSISAYVKGQIFLSQLGYIIGNENLSKALKKYYVDFKMKHPFPNDFIRSAEKVSDIHLGWYLNEWIETTHQIDYAIEKVQSKGDKTRVTLKRLGQMPMPIDVEVEYQDGTKALFYIPLRMMRGEKPNENLSIKRIVLDDWAWAYPSYQFEISKDVSQIKLIKIDPSGLMADVHKGDPFEITKQIEIYADFFKTLNKNYVDPISASELNAKGIKKMLEGTDPYTVFVSQRNIEQSKLYSETVSSNIGIQYAFIDKKIYITNIIKDSPADRKDLKIGDEITSILDFNVEEFGEQITVLLNGAVGSNINLTTLRNGKQTKHAIPVQHMGYNSCVPLFKKIDSDVGYIALREFSKQAYKEVETALAFLKTEGAKAIILDLRGNPGGLLEQAVDIVSLFVPKRTKVVTVKGKKQTHFKEYFTPKKPLDTEIPLIILVNSRSASSSEIVAGSLQDLDRAVIIGQRSFGKGLVQRYFDLKYDTQVKITIARYYTPSGRCIQALDYSKRDALGHAQQIGNQEDIFKTKGGRSVFGGGGISPDIVLKSISDSELIQQMERNYLIFKFVNEYISTQNIEKRKSFSFLDSDWQTFRIYYKNILEHSREEKVLAIQKTLEKYDYNPENRQKLAVKWIDELTEKTLKDLENLREPISKSIEIEVARRIYDEKTLLESKLEKEKIIKKSINVLKSGAYKKLIGK